VEGSKARRSPGRPLIDKDLELLIIRMAKENPDWGYDRIVGAAIWSVRSPIKRSAIS
jgi:putative transposase